MAIDSYLAISGLDLTCEALEAICFSSSRDTEKSEAFSVFKPERNLINSYNFSISFSKLIDPYR
jgi:hypothetical protein